MRLVQLRAAAVEAVLAGVLVGAGEGLHVVHTAGAGAWPIIAATAALGAILIAALVRAVLAGLARIPSFATWGRALREGRAVALWRGGLVAASLAFYAATATALVAWAHEAFRFNDGGPVGLLVAAVLAPLGGLGLVVAVMLDRRIASRLGERTVSRRTLAIAGVVGFMVLSLGPALAARRAIPALTLAPVVTLGALVAVVVASRVLVLGRQRAAHVAGLVLLLGSLAGTRALSSSPPSRGAIVVAGTTSLAVARTIWSVADRDGDRYAGPSVGGADCDDGDAHRNPGAQDIPGNGIDENCTGADAQDQGDRTAPHTATSSTQRPSIVLISIDALRADHLGAYGYARKTSPNLDALAATSVRFDWALTSCPSTRCAIPSLLTGRYASTLRGGAERTDVPTLASTLRAAGWETAAITCCSRFALATNELTGFAEVDASADTVRMQRAGQSNADVVVANALAWLRTRDPQKPFLLWIHLYEPHFPYAAPGGPSFGSSDVDRYDAEIAYADAEIGKLLATLDPSTIVAVTSDHGDEFGEHGIRFHARSLYNPVIHIPLLVRAPGIAPRVVTTPVSLVDVTPTLLDLAGVPGPPGMNGVSLAPAIHGTEISDRPVLIELAPGSGIKRDMAAVVTPPWKVIWDREANAWSVYDLADRAERDDRSSDPVLPTLQKLLLETLDRETSRLP